MLINKKKIKYIIYSILAICITFLFILIYFREESLENNQPTAKGGILDLKEWDFEKDGIISLDGEWEFYWNKLLTYDDFHDGTKGFQPDGYVSVPGVWNSYKINGEMLSGVGYATYRLQIKNSDIFTNKGLKIANMSTAYKLMVNNETIALNGIVSDSAQEAKAEYKPQAVMYKNTSGDYEIIVHISNYIYARGGFWYSIYMGTEQQIHIMKENSSRREMFIFGGIIMMMLYHLSIFIFLRKNISILYYVMMMLIIAIRIPVTGEYFLTDVYKASGIKMMVIIEYLTICWAPITWLLFLNRFYPEEISKAVVRWSVFTGVALTIFTLLAPLRIFTNYLLIYELLVVVLFVYILIRFTVAVSMMREGVVLMLLATAAFFATFVNDALYQWNIISSRSGGIFGLSAFVIIFIQAYVLAAQFSKTYFEVAQMSNKLLSLDKLKDEFLANTSHELRTPLNGIINITNSVIVNNDGKLDEEERQSLQVVVSAARRLHSLINDILDISSLKNGEIQLNIRHVDLRSTASLALYEIERQKNEKQIEFINSIPENFPPVDADVERLRQIFYNLLGNALKFTQSGYIEAGASLKNEVAEIWIKDTGCGIPIEKLDEDIFKPFFQVDSAENREFGGTGLGLSITKKLTELHGGNIWATSIVGKGSQFIFTLPLSKELKTDIYIENTKSIPEEINILSEMTVSERRETNKYSILVAEDDYTNLKALITILNSDNYYLKAVSDGRSALNEIEKNSNYDLLILDVMMPKMTGYQVLEEVRKRFSVIDLPVILLTAKARQRDIKAGFDAGANDYIAKPFEAEELKIRVRTLLQLKDAVNSLVSAELNFLQAQIKPHFLYNTLSVITSLCVREPIKAKELLLHFSDYLRGSFDFQSYNGLIPLSTELQTVKAYLSIEKARFKENVKVEYDIDENISISIPMLTLQPLVENAVRHGILGRIEGGTVKISVNYVNKQVVIIVEDDGIGISEDKLSQLLSSEDVRGVGIKNIDRRMRAIYGHGLQIESKLGYGTKISMIIPLNVTNGVKM